MSFQRHIPWTTDEDAKLIELYNIYGKTWIAISNDMKLFGYHRSNDSCRSRYKIMESYFEKIKEGFYKIKHEFNTLVFNVQKQDELMSLNQIDFADIFNDEKFQIDDDLKCYENINNF